MQFEWDDNNLLHMLVESPNGITPDLLEELMTNGPKLFDDPRSNTSGSHFLIAPDNHGRFCTVAVLEKGDNLWRPITGWPSTNRQIRLYREAH